MIVLCLATLGAFGDNTARLPGAVKLWPQLTDGLIITDPAWLLACGIGVSAQPDKPRVVILSDISNEPDDQQSLVRLLTYANEFDVEGLIATTSCWRRNNPDLRTILKVLDAYEIAEKNLRRHAPGYPSATHLRSVAKRGVDGYGMSAAAEQLDNEGIRHIVSVLERDDPRPVWFCAWGGGNTLGGAVLRLQRERPAEVARLVAKIRGYEIALQDDGFAYIAHHFPDAKLISARLLWKGISRTTPRFNAWSESWGGNNDVFTADWIRENVQRGHGPLGEQYPDAIYLWEGDTPSFLYLLPNGLSDPEQPHWGGWGGRFEANKKTNVRSSSNYEIVNPLLDRLRDYRVFSDASDRWSYRGTNYHNEYATVFRWREAFQNDFAARMDWCVADEFKKANHNPIAVLNGDRTKRVLRLTAKPGETVTLSAEGTHDPDGDKFEAGWWFYPEAGTLRPGASGPFPVTLSAGRGRRTSLITPEVGKPESLHVILEVRDAGTPPLRAFRRAVITIQP